MTEPESTRSSGRYGWSMAARQLPGGPCALIMLSVLAVLLVSGCGGGDGEDTTAASTETPVSETPGLSRDEVISQGDSICAEVNAAIAGLEATGAPAATQLSQRTDLYTGMVEGLRGLESDDPELTDVFTAGRDLVQAAADAQAAAEQGDANATAAAETSVEAALASFQSAASGFGFTECGGETTLPVVPGDSAGGGDPGGVDEGGGEPVEPAPVEPAPEPTEPSGGAPADGGTDDGGVTDGGTGGDTDGGDTGGGSEGSGDSGSTGGFSPG